MVEPAARRPEPAAGIAPGGSIAPAPAGASASTSVFSGPTIVAACLAFMLIGAITAFYGPLLPIFEARFGVGPSVASTMLSAHAIGALAGVLGASQALRFLSNRAFLVLATAVLGAGCLLMALAPAWWVVLLAAGAVGVGFGALDLGVNQLFAYSFGARAGTLLNVLNGVYGIGAVAGPLLIAASSSAPGLVYLGCVAFAAFLVVPLSRVRGEGTPADDSASTPEGRAGRTGGTAYALIVALFALGYMLYVGVESGVGGWEPTHLEATGFTPAAASSATAVFWLGLTLGRFLIAPVALRVRPERIVIGSIAVAIATLCLATISGLAPVAYAATGLAIAPIYPTGLAWLARATPGRRTPTVYLVAAAMVGGAVFPPLVGAAIQVAGAAVTPFALAAIAIGTGLAFGGVAVTGRRATATPG